MTDDRIYTARSFDLAALAVDMLGDAKPLAKNDCAAAQKIIAEEFRIRLIMGDRPDRANDRYK